MVTAPLATTLCHYLQDEYMYHPNSWQHVPGNSVRPWLPLLRGANDRPTPTITSVLKTSQPTLCALQNSIAVVLGKVDFCKASDWQ